MTMKQNDMEFTPNQDAIILLSDCRTKIKTGTWACFPHNLHLVPEINIDRAVRDMAIYIADSQQRELLKHGIETDHWKQVKTIIEKS
jgi:hypothetical protein